MNYPTGYETFGIVGLGNVGSIGGFCSDVRMMANVAPRAYRRAPTLGPNQIAWCKRKGWIDRRTVQRLEPAPAHAREVA